MYIPHLEDQKKIIIFSGAGLDAPSNIQTYRGKNGLWNDNNIDEVCNINTWKNNYKQIHKFYDKLRLELQYKNINDAHKSIKRIYDKYPTCVYNITMNITDFFERLEVPTLHVHGEITKICCDCGVRYLGYEKSPIKCNKCNVIIKPHVVFFGEKAPMYSYLFRALEAISNPNSIVVIIGTHGTVININKLLEKAKCNTILANLEQNDNINEKLFTKIYYGDINNTMEEIEQFIYQHF